MNARAAKLYHCRPCGTKFLSGELSPVCFACDAPATRDGTLVFHPPEPGQFLMTRHRCDSCGAPDTLRMRVILIAPGLEGGGTKLCRQCITARDARRLAQASA